MRRLLPLLILLIAACGRTPAVDKIVPKEEADFAQRFLSYFAARDFAAIEQAMDPALNTAQLRTRMEQIAAVFPRDAPRAVRIVGAQRRQGVTTTLTDIAFEYEYPSSWLLAQVVLQRTPSGLVVEAVHVQPTSQSLAYVNRFTFAGKRVWHYVFFAAAVLVPIVMGYALVLVFRTPGLPLKWLWALFVLVGVGRISLNWTTNHISVFAFAIQLFGSAYARSGPVAPIVLTTSLPLGAILFFIKRATGFGDWADEDGSMARGKGQMANGQEMGHGQGEIVNGRAASDRAEK